MRAKRAFTLLEMALALAILALIASVTAVQIKRLVDNTRFETQVSDLYLALQEAQVLSAAYQSDFALEIRKEKEGYSYRFSTDEPLSQKRFSQQKVMLLAGTRVHFKGQQIADLHLDIYSGGRIEPQGTLSFSSAQSNSLHIEMQSGKLNLKLSLETAVGTGKFT